MADITVHLVDRPDRAKGGFEVRDGNTVISAGAIVLDGAMFAARPDHSVRGLLRYPRMSTGEVLAAIAVAYDGEVAVDSLAPPAAEGR